MNILVTGYKGFIGSNMRTILESNGHNVSLYEWGEELPNIKGLDWCIHIGAISSTVETNVEKIIEQNVDSAIYFYEKCADEGVNFQFSSSASLYGKGLNFSEDAPIDPRTPYAWSKFMVEKYIKDHPKNNIITHIFRYFNVYGPNEEIKGNQASPFCQFKIQVDKYNFIKVFENSDKYKRDFIGVDKVIKTHTEFFNVLDSGIWNVGTGTTLSFLDIAKLFNVPIVEVPFPSHLNHSYQSFTCANLDKLLKTKEKYSIL